MKSKKAIILLSGGLDSATVLAIAKNQGFHCYAMSFSYHQRHQAELDAAAQIAKKAAVIEHRLVKIDLATFGGSALTDHTIAVPESDTLADTDSVVKNQIPVTYVPARNTIFLSYALAWAEVTNCQHIFIGVNAVDYSGYPDCRPAFIQAFEEMANLALKATVQGNRMTIHTPLIKLTKAEIINTGLSLAVDYGLTVSCYQADSHGNACGKCDSCLFRKQGFFDAGIADPTKYI